MSFSCTKKDFQEYPFIFYKAFQEHESSAFPFKSLQPFYLTVHRQPWRCGGHENPEGEIPREHHHVRFIAVY